MLSYQYIPSYNKCYNCTEGRKENNREKNRYNDIIPCNLSLTFMLADTYILGLTDINKYLKCLFSMDSNLRKKIAFMHLIAIHQFFLLLLFLNYR